MKKDIIRQRLAEAYKEAEKYGATLFVSEDDFIDDEHLDCVWYGDHIANLHYKGYIIETMVCGEVRIYGNYLGNEIDYVDKNNDGAWRFLNDITNYFPTDTHFINAIESGEIEFGNNNWIENIVYKDNGDDNIEFIDSYVCDGSNVLDEVCCVSNIIEWIDEEFIGSEEN